MLAQLVVPITDGVRPEQVMEQIWESMTALDFVLPDLHSPPANSHLVQFYESDQCLVSKVVSFIRGGLAHEETCLVIATASHLDEIKCLLSDDGHDASAMIAQQKLILVDAQVVIATYVIDGAFHCELFLAQVHDLLRQALASERKLRVYGEMVALLFADGLRQAAIEVEGLWCGLVKEFEFTLLCAYPAQIFSSPGDIEHLHQICGHHSHVLPAESFHPPPAGEGALPQVVALQARLSSLIQGFSDRGSALERRINFDALTGLPNRALFMSRLQQVLARARRKNCRVALMILDIHALKSLNDAIGMDAGDRLLQQAAERLSCALGPEDTVGRVGDDEFGVILGRSRTMAEVEVAVCEIMESMQQIYVLAGQEFLLGAHMGIALFPDDAESADNLLSNAGAALIHSKTKPDRTYSFYLPEMNASLKRNLHLGAQLGLALERGEFSLVYQPKVNLLSGEITGVEALLRWDRPDLGNPGPQEFIPLLEASRLIIPVGEWLLTEACRQLREVLNLGIADISVSVNISAVQLADENFVSMVDESLAASRLDPARLELEITESSLMINRDSVRNILGKLRRMKVKLAIDDFGTGYSNFSYLKYLPIDVLKIDRSFVSEVTSVADDAMIIRTIVRLAHGLGMQTVAEGIETVQQLAFMRNIRCDQGQGFLFAAPMPAAVLIEKLLLRQPLLPTLPPWDRGHEVLVLLVDASQSCRDSIAALLREEGCSVHVTADAASALDLLALRDFSAIVCDSEIAGMKTLEFLDRVRRMHPKTMRIMHSANTEFDVLAQAVNLAGIQKYFRKDRDEDQLRQEVRKLFWQD